MDGLAIAIDSQPAAIVASRIVKSRKRPRKPLVKSYHCPHCKQSLSQKTFKRHQKLYFRSDGTWISYAEDDQSTDSTQSEEEGRLHKCVGYKLEKL